MNAPNQPSWALAVAEAEPQFTQLAAIDGNLVNYTREAGFAMQIIAGSEYLQKCNRESIRNAVTNVANIGLTLNPAMKLAYLVPRDGRCCLDISYIGLVKIAMDSGAVLAVSAIPVRMNDTFRWKGPFESPEHVFDCFAPADERGDIRGVYTLARLASGVVQVDVMRREEIDYIRQLSKAKRDDAPWKAWFEEMVKKTGIKRASKLWPRTERMSKAEAILNEHEGLGTVIEHEAPPAIEGPQAKPDPAPAAPSGQVQTNAADSAGRSGAAQDRLLPGAKNTLKKALERHGRKEADLVTAGFPAIDEMSFSQHFQKAMDWLKANPEKK